MKSLIVENQVYVDNKDEKEQRGYVYAEHCEDEVFILAPERIVSDC